LVKKNEDWGDIAIYYFLKYYSYEENGVHVADVMRDEYNYSYMDFRSVSGTMGRVAMEARLVTQVQALRDRLKSIMPDEDVSRLREINASLESCLDILDSDAEENRVAYGKFAEAVEGLISMLDKLAPLSDSADEDRRMLELCDRLGRIYEANQDIADVQAVKNQIVMCQDYIQRIFFSGGKL
jgi:hypothetical protein